MKRKQINAKRTVSSTFSRCTTYPENIKMGIRMFGNFQRRQKFLGDSRSGWPLTATSVELMEEIDHFVLDNRIISIVAAAFEMSINHGKTVLKWVKGQLRTFALRKTYNCLKLEINTLKSTIMKKRDSLCLSCSYIIIPCDKTALFFLHL
jgi:hypothetical protein